MKAGGTKAAAYIAMRIEIVDNIHIEPDGVFVTAKPNLKNGTAEIEISANILNRYFEEKSVWVEAEIKTATVIQFQDWIGQCQ